MPKSGQFWITTEPYIDESKQGAKLFSDHPIQLNLKKKLSIHKPKPYGRLRKAVASIKNTVVSSHIRVKVNIIITNILKRGSASSKADTTTNITILATKINSRIYEPIR